MQVILEEFPLWGLHLSVCVSVCASFKKKHHPPLSVAVIDGKQDMNHL